MTTPDELRDLDRQVAEALGWRWQLWAGAAPYPLMAMAPDGDIVIKGTAHYFSPTTDARQWAVLQEMGHISVEPTRIVTAQGWADGWAAATSGRRWASAMSIGEAVVRAFLAWMESKK